MEQAFKYHACRLLGMLTEALSVCLYYIREGYLSRAKFICTEEVQRTGNPTFRFWKGVSFFLEGENLKGTEELDALREGRDYALPALTALQYFKTLGKNIDKNEIRSMEDKIQECKRSAHAWMLVTSALFQAIVGNFEGARTNLSFLSRSDDQPAEYISCIGWVELMACQAATEVKVQNKCIEIAIQNFERALVSNANLFDAQIGLMRCLSVRRQATEAQALALSHISRLDDERKSDDQERLAQMIGVNRNSPAAGYETALNLADPRIVFLSERVKGYIVNTEWDHVVDVINELTSREPGNLDAMFASVIYLIAKEPGQVTACHEQVESALQRMELLEPQSLILWMTIVRAFGRSCGGDLNILRKCKALTEVALRRARNFRTQAHVCVEMGQVNLLLKLSNDAATAFSEAATHDSSNPHALVGVANCAIQQNNLEDARSHLEFLSVLQTSAGRVAEIPLLSARLEMLNNPKSLDVKNTFSLLSEALTTHAVGFRMALGLQFLARMDAALMVKIANQLLQLKKISDAQMAIISDPNVRRLAAEKSTQAVQKASTVLDTVIKLLPGLMHAQVLFAECKLAVGEYANAVQLLHAVNAAQNLLSRQDSRANNGKSINPVRVSFALARALKEAGDLQEALVTLDMVAVKFGNQIVTKPFYRLLKAETMHQNGEILGAISMLEASLPELRSETSDNKKTNFGDTTKKASNGNNQDDDEDESSIEFSGPETKAAIYTLLVELYEKSCEIPGSTTTRLISLDGSHLSKNQQDTYAKAYRVIEDAVAELTGTPFEAKIALLNASIQVAKGEVSNAIRLLKNIPVSAPEYVDAQFTLAKLYSTKYKDRRRFLEVLQDCSELVPSSKTYMARADALLDILDAEGAVEWYVKAYKIGLPSDITPLQKAGNAVILTHRYVEAGGFYENTLGMLAKEGAKLTGDSTILPVYAVHLLLDYARLSARLRRFDIAKSQLDTAERACVAAQARGEGESAGSGGSGALVRLRATIREQLADVLIDTARSSIDKKQMHAGIAPQANDSLLNAVTALKDAQKMLEEAYQQHSSTIKSDDEHKWAASSLKLVAEQAANVARKHARLLRDRFNDYEASLAAYNEALTLMQNISANYSPSQIHALGFHREISGIYFEMALLHLNTNDNSKAESALQNSIKADSANSVATRKLTELRILAATNPWSNVHADIRKQASNAAYKYASSCLQRNAKDYAALSLLSQLLSFEGQSMNIQKYLTDAEKSGGSAMEAGYRYCRGLMRRWTRNLQGALEDFSFACRDVGWRQQSLENMIEIYLRLDDACTLEAISSSDTSGKAGSTGLSDDLREEVNSLITQLASTITTSDISDEDINGRGGANTDSVHLVGASLEGRLRIRTLTCWAMIATKEKSLIETALRQLQQISTDGRKPDGSIYVPSHLAAAVGTMTLDMRNEKAARTILKSIVEEEKKRPVLTWRKDYERTHLFLADLYIKQGKYDDAHLNAASAKNSNPACIRAHEQLGIVHEKMMGFRDAAAAYEVAFNLSNKTSGSLGYRLAFNLLKSKMYIRALDVGIQLVTSPEVAEVHKKMVQTDILDKARACLRP